MCLPDARLQGNREGSPEGKTPGRSREVRNYLILCGQDRKLSGKKWGYSKDWLKSHLLPTGFPPGISTAPGYFWPSVSLPWRLCTVSRFSNCRMDESQRLQSKLKKIIILSCPNSFLEILTLTEIVCKPFFSPVVLKISSLIKKNCLPDTAPKCLFILTYLLASFFLILLGDLRTL